MESLKVNGGCFYCKHIFIFIIITFLRGVISFIINLFYFIFIFEILGWMDGVKLALGNRGMTGEAARQCSKDRKEWRALVHM